MTTAKTAFVTDPGRFVQGDAFRASDKDQNGAPRVIKTGPNAGQPNPQLYVAVALPKTPGLPVTPARQAPNLDAEIATGSRTGQLFKLLKETAVAAFPHLFANGANPMAFSYKVVDGDGWDDKGQPWSRYEGFAGHWILKATRNVATVGPAQVYTKDAATNVLTPVTSGRPRPGDMLQLAGSFSSNDNAANPGVYCNLDMICMTAEGPEIVTTSGPDAGAAFGGTVAPAHPAAAAAFVAPAAAVPSPVPAPSAAPPAPAASVPAPAVPSPSPVPPPAPAAPVPPVPARPSLKAEHVASGLTYDAMIAGGWTDETLRANGYMD